ncbi:MAG: hypothetical protein JJ863_38845 [Deltaproteobacteria bacterium]|nr:hypothetical protein [Deltaproteobacteria bacterium]
MRASKTLALPILAMLLTPLTTGCLITDPIDIPEDVNYPPSIVSDTAAPEPRYPIEEIVTLDRDVDESLTFAVIVRDPNFDDDLDYEVYLNFDPDAPLTLVDFGKVEVTESLERPLAFTVNNLALFPRGQCHKLELRVSEDFEGGGTPTVPGDIDIAVWWINSLSEDGTPTDLATCPD